MLRASLSCLGRKDGFYAIGGRTWFWMGLRILKASVLGASFVKGREIMSLQQHLSFSYAAVGSLISKPRESTAPTDAWSGNPATYWSVGRYGEARDLI